MAQHVLPRMLDADSAKLVEAWLQKKGLTLHTGTTVSKIEASGNRKRLTLANGKTLEADIVIIATGIRANLDLVAGSGIKTDQGILVNDRMQTNFPHIYAAGDVAQGPDLLGGSPAVHAIQPTAIDHGRIAGANMAGQEVHYPGSLLMNILDACGLQCASFGRWNDRPSPSLTKGGEGGVEATTINNPDRPVFRRLLWTGSQITGAIFAGQASDVGMLTDLGMVKGIIQTRTDLGEWKEFLKKNPFDVRRPYIAMKVGEKLVQTTLLGKPSKARQYRFQNAEPTPQVTKPEAHQLFVGMKGE
jgi:NAD(P)H-nitrite reductase large subunit